jgi:hypothetical protein
MISGIFRSILWNQTIPNHLRGRLAGIEMIGYTSGPLLGNTQSGLMAALIGTHNAIVLGGGLCIIGIWTCARFLPKFFNYSASRHAEENNINEENNAPRYLAQ